MFQNIIRAVSVAGTVAFAFTTWWHQPTTKYFPDMTAQTEVVIHDGQIDYCEIDTHWATGWELYFGPCYLLDRFEDVALPKKMRDQHYTDHAA